MSKEVRCPLGGLCPKSCFLHGIMTEAEKIVEKEAQQGSDQNSNPPMDEREHSAGVATIRAYCQNARRDKQKES